MSAMLLSGAFTLLCNAESAWSDTLNSAQADPAVDAARAAALTTPPASALAPGSEFASLQPKGFNLALPGPADTVDPEAFGMRRALADAGIGFIGMNLFNMAYNTLQGSARSNNGTQQYNGQTFSYTNSFIAGVTYDLSRFGIPDGQFYVAGINTMVSWAPLGPNKTSLSQMTYYQTLFSKRLELKLGYTTNTWQFANIYVGGSLASSVFGPSGSIPIQGGMSSNSTPTPGINLKYWVTDKWYLQGAVQRSVNPDGLQAETQYNPTGFDWSTPNSGALYLGEAGYQRAPAADRPMTWMRVGGAYNTSNFKSYEHPGTRVDHNGYLYFVGDRQLWQTHPSGAPGRGLYAGASVMYAPPYANAVSQYYELRLYAKGIFESRPYDLISLVATDSVWGSDAIRVSQAAGNLVHRDSKAITLSWSARLVRGVYGSLGVGYVNHPTSIAYKPETGSALNLLGNLNIFF